MLQELADGPTNRRSRRQRSGFSSTIYKWPEISRRLTAIREAGKRDRALFFRHGQTNYNVKSLITGQHDTSLSPLGEQQAQQLRKTMPKRVSHIFCSRLVRTRQTLELAVPPQILSRIEPIEDARLNEVSLGDLEGRRRIHLAQFEEGDIDFAPPNGESYRQAATRVCSFVVDLFETMAGEEEPGTALIFTHAGVLRIVSSLTRRTRTPAAMFAVDIKNAMGVQLTANEIFLPAYWGADTEPGGHRRETDSKNRRDS